MVPLGRVILCSHRLCIWHRLAEICDASFDWGCLSPQFGETGGRRGLEMGPLDSPVVISYRLPRAHSNHRPISHRFGSALSCHRQTDGTG